MKTLVDLSGSNFESIGFMQLLTEEDLSQKELIENLRDWRQQANGWFLTESDGSLTATESWIRNYVGKGDYFWIIKLNDGKPVGHVGIKKHEKEFELDNLVRGERGGPGELMFIACKQAMEQVSANCTVENFINQTFEDNIAALRIHKRLGFQIRERRVMELVGVGGGNRKWVPTCNATGRTLLVLEKAI